MKGFKKLKAGKWSISRSGQQAAQLKSYQAVLTLSSLALGMCFAFVLLISDSRPANMSQLAGQVQMIDWARDKDLMGLLVLAACVLLFAVFSWTIWFLAKSSLRPGGTLIGSRMRLSENFRLIFFTILPLVLVANNSLEFKSSVNLFLARFAHLWIELSVPFLVTLVLVGLLEVVDIQKGVRWIKKGTPFVQTVRSIVLGIPLPVCSCSVLPLFENFRKSGIPLSALAGFLIAAPEIGLDSMVMSVPLLGVQFTVVRLVGAFLLALGAGLLAPAIYRLTVSQFRKFRPLDAQGLEGSEKHNLKSGQNVHSTHSSSSSDCCAKVSPSEKKENPLFSVHSLKKVFKGAFEALEHIGPWVLVGTIAGALLGPLIEDYFVKSQVNPFVEVAIFSMIGVPLYVCASGATPLLSVLLSGGISPGAGLAFILSGPATNISTFGVLSRIYGPRFAASFGMVIVFLAFLLGVLVNLFFEPADFAQEVAFKQDALTQGTESVLGFSGSLNEVFMQAPVTVFFSLVLAGMFGVSLWKLGPRGFSSNLLGKDLSHNHADHHHQ